MKAKNDSRKARGTLRKYALSFFYPERCIYCGRVIDLRLTVCSECADSLNEIKGEICLLCGFMKADCRCGEKKSFYKAVAAPYYYDGSAGKLIRRFKFGNEPSLGRILAEKMAEFACEVYSDIQFDAVTSVPMHKEKLRERGYNQAELLARELEKLTGIPYAPMLEKIYDTKPQHSLSRDGRTANLLGAFNLIDSCELEGKTVLLIDDIKTTGSTLNECAKTLLIGGVKEVYCLCGAIVKKEAESDSDETVT